MHAILQRPIAFSVSQNSLIQKRIRNTELSSDFLKGGDFSSKTGMPIYLFTMRNIRKIRFLSLYFIAFLYHRHINQENLITIIFSVNFCVLNNLIFKAFLNDLDETYDILQIHLKLYFSNKSKKIV